MKIETNDYTVTYRDDQQAKDRIFNILLKHFKKQEHYCGESISQSDETYVNAPGLLTEIAEKGFRFKQFWKE